MEIRKATYNDIESMMTIIKQAQLYFYNHGIDQWQDGYPNPTQLHSDITKGNSYVLCDDQVIGTMYFAIEEDINYPGIVGQWLTGNEANYGVIHRIVVDENYKGNEYAKILLDFAVERCKQNHISSIRIDTHKDNLSMQRFLLKNNFKLCGDITLQSGAPRIALEKIID